LEKRVLVYTNHFYPENFRINELVFSLSLDGFSVSVITCIPNYPQGKFYKGYNIFNKLHEKLNKNLKVYRMPHIPRGNGSKINLILNYFSFFISTFIFTIYIMIFKKKYDKIIVHHTSPILITFHPIIYKIIRRSKIILWDLDMWPQTLIAMNIIKNKLSINFFEKLMKFVYMQYDKILLGSQSFIEIGRKRTSQNNLEYFPNWAEKLYFEEINTPKKKLKFPEGFNILYTGNIGEAQDFNTIVEAAKSLNNYNINFILIGDGRYRRDLSFQIKREGLKNIYLFDYQPQETIPYYFSVSEVLIFTLKAKDIFSKTVPAKLQAYMSAKKPIIGIISGEGKQIIEKSKCGFAIPSGKPEILISKILKLKDFDKKRREKLGKNGFEYYVNNFDYQNRINQLKKIIN